MHSRFQIGICFSITSVIAMSCVPFPTTPDKYESYSENAITSLQQLTQDDSIELATDVSPELGLLVQSNRLTKKDEKRKHIQQVFLLPLGGTTFQQLTFGNTTSALASFSKAFSTEQNESQTPSLTTDTPDTDTSTIDTVNEPAQIPNSQPDAQSVINTQIIYRSSVPHSEENNHFQITLGQGPAATLLFTTSGNGLACPARVTADGKKIVYDNGGQIWMFEKETQAFINLGEGTCPSWYPDGKSILYNKLLYTVEKVEQFYSIWSMSIDGTNRRELTAAPNNSSLERASVSPDGKYIVFEMGTLDEQKNWSYDIWLMDSEGRNKTQITTHPAGDVMPLWLDNDNIIFSSRRASKPSLENWNIWMAKIQRP